MNVGHLTQTISSASEPPGEVARTRSKAVKAGAEFEAILLNNVLGGIEQAFTRWPGNKPDQCTQAYNGLAMQTLTAKMAKSGGIGLGKLITESLLKDQKEVPER